MRYFILTMFLLTGCAQVSQDGTCALVSKGELPIIFDSDKPIVEVLANGEKLRFLVDTGSNLSLLLKVTMDQGHIATDPPNAHC